MLRIGASVASASALRLGMRGVAVRAFSTTMAHRAQIKNVMVIGSGQMGGGIGMVGSVVYPSLSC